MVKWSYLLHVFPLILLEQLKHRATAKPFAGGISECGGLRLHSPAFSFCISLPHTTGKIKDIFPSA